MLSCQLHLCEQCRTIFPSLCLMLHCITSLHMYNVSLSDLWIHHWQCNLSIESSFDLGKRWCLKHLSKIDQNYVFDFAVVGKHSSFNSHMILVWNAFNFPPFWEKRPRNTFEYFWENRARNTAPIFSPGTIALYLFFTNLGHISLIFLTNIMFGSKAY